MTPKDSPCPKNITPSSYSPIHLDLPCVPIHQCYLYPPHVAASPPHSFPPSVYPSSPNLYVSPHFSIKAGDKVVPPASQTMSLSWHLSLRPPPTPHTHSFPQVASLSLCLDECVRMCKRGTESPSCPGLCAGHHGSIRQLCANLKKAPFPQNMSVGKLLQFTNVVRTRHFYSIS